MRRKIRSRIRVRIPVRKKIRAEISIVKPNPALSLEKRLSGYVSATNKSRQIINYWNQLENTVTHNVESKVVRRTLKYLDAWFAKTKDKPKMFDKMFDKIRSTMFTFNVLLTDKVIDAPNISIFEFFKGNKYRVDHVKYYSLLSKPRSLELFLVQRGTAKEYNVVEERLTYIYCKQVLGRPPENTSINERHKGQLGLAARRLVQFIKKGDMPFLKHLKGATLDDLIRVMLQSLKWYYWQCRKVDFSYGHLCSDFTFNHVMPKFLQRSK